MLACRKGYPPNGQSNHSVAKPARSSVLGSSAVAVITLMIINKVTQLRSSALHLGLGLRGNLSTIEPGDLTSPMAIPEELTATAARCDRAFAVYKKSSE